MKIREISVNIFLIDFYAKRINKAFGKPSQTAKRPSMDCLRQEIHYDKEPPPAPPQGERAPLPLGEGWGRGWFFVFVFVFVFVFEF